MLWQKISSSNDYDMLVRLLTSDIPPEHRGPGTYMFEALKFRDQWQSRLLRTSAWSPRISRWRGNPTFAEVFSHFLYKA